MRFKLSINGVGDVFASDVLVEARKTLVDLRAVRDATMAAAASVTPAGLAVAMAALSAPQLQDLAAAVVAAAPSSAFALAMRGAILSLPTAPTSGVTTLWSDGGVPVVSQG